MPPNNPDVLAQDTEIDLLLTLLPHVHPSLIDVGAEQGAFARLLTERGMSAVLFEPLPKHQPALEALARTDRIRHFTYAIDQSDGKAEFHIACDERGRPLDYFHSLQRLDQDPRVRHTQTLAVTCRSLASLLAEGVVGPQPGILKIDTEGNDLRVLRGLGPMQPDVIVCEFFTAGVYNGWSDANPVGLIEEGQKLGYARWLAVRRRGENELISLNPLRFTEKEWGNLIFMREPVFAAAWPALSAAIAARENQFFLKSEKGAQPKRKRWYTW